MKPLTPKVFGDCLARLHTVLQVTEIFFHSLDINGVWDLHLFHIFTEFTHLVNTFKQVPSEREQTCENENFNALVSPLWKFFVSLCCSVECGLHWGQSPADWAPGLAGAGRVQCTGPGGVGTERVQVELTNLQLEHLSEEDDCWRATPWKKQKKKQRNGQKWKENALKPSSPQAINILHGKVFLENKGLIQGIFNWKK